MEENWDPRAAVRRAAEAECHHTAAASESVARTMAPLAAAAESSTADPIPSAVGHAARDGAKAVKEGGKEFVRAVKGEPSEASKPD